MNVAPGKYKSGICGHSFVRGSATGFFSKFSGHFCFFIGRKGLLNLAVIVAKNGNTYEICLAGIVHGNLSVSLMPMVVSYLRVAHT